MDASGSALRVIFFTYQQKEPVTNCTLIFTAKYLIKNLKFHLFYRVLKKIHEIFGLNSQGGLFRSAFEHIG